MNNMNENNWNYDESGAKVVLKPWGKEVWVNYRKGENIGDEEKRYIMKKLYIKRELEQASSIITKRRNKFST